MYTPARERKRKKKEPRQTTIKKKEDRKQPGWEENRVIRFTISEDYLEGGLG
jgi:hypothetical protein